MIFRADQSLSKHTKRIRCIKNRILALFSVGVIFLLLPVPAYAYESDRSFWDVGGQISDMIAGWLLDLSRGLFQGYFHLVESSTSTSYMSGTFSELFGSTTVYELVKTVHSSAVVPLANSILALFMLVQLVKISQRIDATATLPAVKDIVFLAVTYVIFHWLISNSLEIVSAIFDEFNKLVTAFTDTGGSNTIMEEALDWSSINLSKVSVGNCIMLLLCAILCYFTGFIGFIIALLMSMARVIQLYVMAAFAPLPLSLLGFEETRQSGISFLKNFCAACLAGAIMMFLFVAYPTILGSTISHIGSSDLISIAQDGIGTASNLSALLSIATWIAVSILLGMGLIKSGAWAKEILGN